MRLRFQSQFDIVFWALMLTINGINANKRKYRLILTHNASRPTSIKTINGRPTERNFKRLNCANFAEKFIQLYQKVNVGLFFKNHLLLILKLLSF